MQLTTLPLLLLLLLVVGVVAAAPKAGPQAFVFNQTLDHFNFQVKQTFGQNYYVNDQFWNGTGPILFYVGAETPTAITSVEYLVTVHYAQQTGGLVVAAEHRYYGTSLPFGSHPTPEEFGWLTIEQALADYAVIVLHVKERYNTTNPAYCFGGSYGGLLSALLRIKYGNVFWGSVASASPLFANRADPENWFRLVSISYLDHDRACGESIREAYRMMRKLSQTQEGRDSIASAFGMCPEFRIGSEDAAKEALWWSAWAFSFVTEFNYPFPGLYAPEHTPPLPYACKLVNGGGGGDDVVSRIGKAVQFGFNVSFAPVPCFNSTDLWQTGAVRVLEVGSWLYQVCTAVVLPAETDGVNDLFAPYGWSDYLHKVWTPLCQAKFGVTPDPDYIEKYLVGTGVESYSRIIFTSGSYDPVRAFSPVTDVSPDLLAFHFVGGHTQDIQPPFPGEDPSITAMRAKVLDVLLQWSRLHKQQRRA